MISGGAIFMRREIVDNWTENRDQEILSGEVMRASDNRHDIDTLHCDFILKKDKEQVDICIYHGWQNN